MIYAVSWIVLISLDINTIQLTADINITKIGRVTKHFLLFLKMLDCRTRALPATVKARLPEVIRLAGVKIEDMPLGYYNFVLRIARWFGSLLKREKDPLVSRRKTILAKALEKGSFGVPNKPDYLKPPCNNEMYMNIMSLLFELSGHGPREGSPAWVATMASKIQTVEYHYMIEYPALMKAHIKERLASDTTDSEGCPILKDEEEVPDGTYKRLADDKRLENCMQSR